MILQKLGKKEHTSTPINSQLPTSYLPKCVDPGMIDLVRQEMGCQDTSRNLLILVK